MKTVSDSKMHEQQGSLSEHTHVFPNNKWDGNLHDFMLFYDQGAKRLS